MKIVNQMDRERAVKAIGWTINLLGFHKPLTAEQMESWVQAAMQYTDKEWTMGIKDYYAATVTDFTPPLGRILEYMPKRVEGPKKPQGTMDWPEGFKEDERPYEEQFKDYMKATRRWN